MVTAQKQWGTPPCVSYLWRKRGNVIFLYNLSVCPVNPTNTAARDNFVPWYPHLLKKCPWKECLLNSQCPQNSLNQALINGYDDNQRITSMVSRVHFLEDGRLTSWIIFINFKFVEEEGSNLVFLLSLFQGLFVLFDSEDLFADVSSINSLSVPLRITCSMALFNSLHCSLSCPWSSWNQQYFALFILYGGEHFYWFLQYS